MPCISAGPGQLQAFQRSPVRTQAFLPMSETYHAWNFQNVQSVGGGFLTTRDQLRFSLVRGQVTAPVREHAQTRCMGGGTATVPLEARPCAPMGSLLSRPQEPMES